MERKVTGKQRPQSLKGIVADRESIGQERREDKYASGVIPSYLLGVSAQP